MANVSEEAAEAQGLAKSALTLARTSRLYLFIFSETGCLVAPRRAVLLASGPGGNSHANNAAEDGVFAGQRGIDSDGRVERGARGSGPVVAVGLL